MLSIRPATGAGPQLSSHLDDNCADWSVIDPVILHKAIASERAHFCEYCQDALHATTACPFTLSTSSSGTETTKPTAPNNRPLRTKIYHKGIEVCGNFNLRESGCNLKNCNYVHVCSFCQSEKHGRLDCKKYRSSKSTTE